MQSQDLALVLSPFKLLSSKHALSATYRCLEIGSDYVRGCASYAFLEKRCSLKVKGVDLPCFVDASTFLAVIDSLPAGQEVELAVAEGVLSWVCGSARGKLALAVIEKLPEFPARPPNVELQEPSATFLEALEVGALSCDSSALASVGLYGVIIDTRNDFRVISTDNVTISSCSFDCDMPDTTPDLVTLPPDAIALILKVLGAGSGKFDVDERDFFFQGKISRLLVRQVPSLKQDLGTVLDPFTGGELAVPLPRDAVRSFIKRADALAESKRSVYVTLGVQKGQLSLSFLEGTAASEEYYLVKDLDVPDLAEIKLDARKMARALAYADEVVVDFIDRRVLVLRGKKPAFTYLISGRTS